MSATHRGRRFRRIAGRHFRTSVVALAVALTGAAIMAAGASAATQCVYRTFGPSNTYQPCVRDEQILLNDLWYDHSPGVNQLLATDGYYGPHTASDVASFTRYFDRSDPTATTDRDTWITLCQTDWNDGFHGSYWQDVGCPLVY